MNAKATKYLTPTDVVKREYSKARIVRSLLEKSIWPSEEILITRYFNKGESILDIACGAGRIAVALALKGFEVTGIDFSKEMLDGARMRAEQNKANVTFLSMDANEMKFPDQSFHNVVFLYNAYELIWKESNRVKLLKEIYRIIKPGGHFILTSRSSFAFYKRWLAWPWLLLRTYILKPLGIGNPHLELCDVFSKGTYHRYQSPFSIRKDLNDIGFLCKLFNSGCNLEANREASFFTNFSSDKCLYFVVQKPF